jgi:hypothetical protein
MDEKDIRERLEAMRENLGSWYAVAKRLGVSRQYLQHYVTNGNVGRKLLEAMGLEVRYVRKRLAGKPKQPA